MIEYPLKYKLKDGTPVLIRLLGKDDKEGLNEGFKKLSPYSQYCRFFSPIGHLSKNQLEYLTEIDYENHLAICTILDDDEFQTGIGVARYIKKIDDPETAEMAITVIDEYQNLGLGKKLLELLIEEGKNHGVNVFTGDVLEENIPMLEIFKKYSCNYEKNEGKAVTVELNISENAIQRL